MHSRTIKIAVCFLAIFGLLGAQERTGGQEIATINIGRHAGPIEGAFGGTPAHPFTAVARHPKPGCDNTAVCGEEFYRYTGHNLRTSAGTTWQFNQMAGTTAAVGNFLALTNTGITAAEADTTLSGEIAANGLSRASATVTNNSGTLTAPSAPTTAVTGTTGTAVFYFVEACNQGICTAPSAASASTSVASTLNATNYVTVTWTPISGAASYVIIRSNSSSAPSGSLAGGSTLTSTGGINGAAACTSSTCTAIDTSNTVTALTAGTTANTNFGTYTLVHTWTCTTSAQSAQAYGVFNASSSGTLIFEGTFTPVALNVGDTFQLTETIVM